MAAAEPAQPDPVVQVTHSEGPLLDLQNEQPNQFLESALIYPLNSHRRNSRDC